MTYLAHAYSRNDEADRRVREHQDLVRRIAWHFHARVGRRVEIDDLLQVGYVGLMDASRRYVAQPGVSFSAYAAIRIRGAIVDYLRSVSNICRTTLRQMRKLDETTRQLEQKLLRKPSDEELADATGVTVAEIASHRAELSAGQHSSLDEVYADHLLAFRDLGQAAEERIEQRELRQLLAKAVRLLPEREQMVLQLYYVEELNIYEVADIMGVTTGRVSQIKKAATGRLREIMARQMGEGA